MEIGQILLAPLAWIYFFRLKLVDKVFTLCTKFISADLILGPNTIEPDKGGIAGYALILLYNATKDSRYLNQAIQNAKVLLENMAIGKIVFDGLRHKETQHMRLGPSGLMDLFGLRIRRMETWLIYFVFGMLLSN